MRYNINPVRLSLLILFALLLRANTASAQNLIAFTPSGLAGWPDTAFAGDSIPVGGYLKNYSNNFFNDTLMIQGYVDTGAAPVPFLIDYSYLWPAFSIAPSDSQFVILPISFEPGNTGGYFHVGNNVVVVWPISVGPDSFRTND